MPTVRRCCIIGCNSNSREKPQLQFFQFPKPEHPYHKLWTQACHASLSRIMPFKKPVVCALHFHPNNIGGRRLTGSAIPCMNLEVPTNLSNMEQQSMVAEIERSRKCAYINAVVYEWLVRANLNRNLRGSITHGMIKDKAEGAKSMIGLDTFVADNRWLNRFRQTHLTGFAAKLAGNQLKPQGNSLWIPDIVKDLEHLFPPANADRIENMPEQYFTYLQQYGEYEEDDNSNNNYYNGNNTQNNNMNYNQKNNYTTNNDNNNYNNNNSMHHYNTTNMSYEGHSDGNYSSPQHSNTSQSPPPSNSTNLLPFKRLKLGYNNSRNTKDTNLCNEPANGDGNITATATAIDDDEDDDVDDDDDDDDDDDVQIINDTRKDIQETGKNTNDTNQTNNSDTNTYRVSPQTREEQNDLEKNTPRLMLRIKNTMQENPHTSSPRPLSIEGNNVEHTENAPSSVSRKLPPKLNLMPNFKSLESYTEALKYIKPLEDFVLLKENFRAIGLLSQLEIIFRRGVAANSGPSAESEQVAI